jgi:hypothetical protein
MTNLVARSGFLALYYQDLAERAEPALGGHEFSGAAHLAGPIIVLAALPS